MQKLLIVASLLLALATSTLARPHDKTGSDSADPTAQAASDTSSSVGTGLTIFTVKEPEINTKDQSVPTQVTVVQPAIKSGSGSDQQGIGIVGISSFGPRRGSGPGGFGPSSASASSSSSAVASGGNGGTAIANSASSAQAIGKGSANASSSSSAVAVGK